MEINKFILFLQNIEGIGNGAIRKLIISNAFKSFEPNTLEDVLIWIKNHRDYFAKKTIVDQMTIGKLEEANKKRKIIEEKCNEYGVKYISYFDNMYPRRFKEMANNSKTVDFPVILYYLGNIELLNADKICSIIGTREPSDKAKKVGIQASRLITKEGYVVMSGLAEGCDTIGHVGCLDENGKTIAIVGTGLDTVFPKSNINLQKQILETGGLVISEYPVGFKGAQFAFVERDRLQAAGSDLVLVIQTSIKGGTMHAAKACVEKYNKKLSVISPSLIDDGDTTGNYKLIHEYFAKEINELDQIGDL
jgi:DNA processing protein